MDHNQTVVDQYLKNILATESRITTPDLYEGVKAQLKPEMELIEFRIWLAEQFRTVLNTYESVKGRYGGIRLVSEESRAVKAITEMAHSGSEMDSNEVSSESETTEQESLTIQMSPSIRIYKTDLRNWAVQKRSGDNWLSQYYNTSLDGIMSSYVRHALDDEFRTTPEKIKDIKEVIKIIRMAEANLIETFKKIVVEKSATID